MKSLSLSGRSLEDYDTINTWVDFKITFIVFCFQNFFKKELGFFWIIKFYDSF